MRIIVDADACPVKDIILDIAKRNSIKVIMVKSIDHNINDSYAEIITCDRGRESVDIKLANLVKREDIAVTQDFALAALILGKGASCLNQNGLIFTNDNIDSLLMSRHIKSSDRRKRNKYSKIASRTPNDDKNFIMSLNKLILLKNKEDLNKI